MRGGDHSRFDIARILFLEATISVDSCHGYFQQKLAL